MVKRHPYANNYHDWLTHVENLRGSHDVTVLNAAIDLYPTPSSPLFDKGLYIADVMLKLGLDSETIAAALVYPAFHEHEIHIDTITEIIGESTHKLLHDVLQMQSLSKLQQVGTRKLHHIENLRKMLLAMVTDVRAVLVVLAERLWQLHEAKNSQVDAQKKLAQETLDVFAPLANRLGVWQLKWEIEDLCLRYLEPEIYSKIAKWLASRRQEREAYVEDVIQMVKHILVGTSIKHFEINGRVKHIYSIYRKMQRKGSRFDEIYDITALRVLVPSVDDCYTVLSILQDEWEQVLEEFDDYILKPKPNGYQSIHTVLIGPQKHFIEVQIRTFEMHEASEMGVAAHWRYKEGVLQPSDYEAKIALLRQIMAWQKELVKNESVKEDKPVQDIFADRVYVFTPAGDIIDLPQGATPLDFAYHIHSEVGHRCRGAKINGNIVPLTYSLQTGERVEILTAKQPNPSRDWLNIQLGYLKTPRARAKAQHWFRTQDSMQNISVGRDLFEKEVKKLGLTDKIDMTLLANKFNYKTGDDLLAALAMGDIRMMQISHYLRPHLPVSPLPFAIEKPKEQARQVEIVGINNLLTQIARCCKPLPGDPITGYVTRSRGVSIHRQNCSNVLHIAEMTPERLLEVSWGDAESRSYPVDLVVHAEDRSGLLRDITAALASEKIQVLGLQTQKGLGKNEAQIFLTIEIATRDQLRKAVHLLETVPSVMEAKRR